MKYMYTRFSPLYFFFTLDLLILCMRMFCLQLYMWCACITCSLVGPEQGTRVPRTGVIEGWVCHLGAGNRVEISGTSVLSRCTISLTGQPPPLCFRDKLLCHLDLLLRTSDPSASTSQVLRLHWEPPHLGKFIFCYIFLYFFLFYIYFLKKCSCSWPGTQYVFQASLDLRDLPAPTSQMLELKACSPSPCPLVGYWLRGSDGDHAGNVAVPCVPQDNLELMIFLPLPPQYWDYRHVPMPGLGFFFFLR